MSIETLRKRCGITYEEVVEYLGHLNIFRYAGDTYIGLESDRVAYYKDKLEGTNPFYQTW